MLVEDSEIALVNRQVLVHQLRKKYFFNSIHFQVWLVTGGSDKDDELKSTEILKEGESSWAKLPPSGDLTSAVSGARGVVINNMVYVVGVNAKDILKLEYSDDDDDNIKWSKTGSLKIGRFNHAVSVIDLDKLRKYC